MQDGIIHGKTNRLDIYRVGFSTLSADYSTVSRTVVYRDVEAFSLLEAIMMLTIETPEGCDKVVPVSCTLISFDKR